MNEMTDAELQTLELLLRKFRDIESCCKDEWDERELVRLDVVYECNARDLQLAY